MTPQRSDFNPQASIELHIDELVVYGLPLTNSQGRLVRDAVEKELGRLLLQHGMGCSIRSDSSQLSVIPIQLAKSNQPSHLGQQIAQAVYIGLTSNPTAASQTHDSKGEIR